MTPWLVGLYLTGGLAYVPPDPAPPTGRAWLYQASAYSQPYGVAAIGWSTDSERPWSAALELRHISSIGADLHHGGNYGMNSAEARITWRPWAARDVP